MQKTRIIIPADFCRMEVIKYIAGRYDTTPEEVISHFLMQEGVLEKSCSPHVPNYFLRPNERNLLRDLGVRPEIVEIGNI